MKNVFLGLVVCVVVAFVISPNHSHAQESCGSIIEYYDYGDGPVIDSETPIEDCDNPFGIAEVDPALVVTYGDTTLEHGSTYAFLTGNAYPWNITGYTSEYAEGILYLHSGSDYILKQYIPNGESYRFTEAGTYTFVVSEMYSPVMTRGSALERFRELFIPTAFASYIGPALAVTFTVTEPVEEPAGASSVLFIPGIMGSRLYAKDGDGDEDRLWEPHGNQDVRQLEMTETGESVEPVYTRDVIDAAYGAKDMYNKFSAFMDGLASQEIIEAWKPFAYDWRYGVVDIANDGTQYEDTIYDAVDEIEALKENSFSKKVTIVAHSNGGLLAKALLTRLEQEGKTNLVDRVILLASPQLGTPEAIGVLLHGYDQEQAYGLLMDDAEIRTVAKNMPGVYGLVPSQKYFEKSGSVPVTFDTGVSTQEFVNVYGSTIDTTSELTEFMVGDIDGRTDAVEIYEASHAQRPMLENAFSDHNTVLDTWVAPEGVEVIEVIGIGLNTVHQFKYEQFMERKCLFCAREPIYKPVPQFSLYGDETVMGYSAEGYEGEKSIWYVDLGSADKSDDDAAFSVEHANFLNAPPIQTLLRNTLTNETSITPFIYSTPPTFSGITYTIISTHSPVSLEIIDTEGRRVGKGTSTPQTDIPGSTYLELAGSTYIIVPQGVEYDVSIKGTGYGGMTFVTESLTGDTQTRMSIAEVATITPSTTITLSVAENTFSNLVVDTNGDNVIDQELTIQGEIIVPEGTYLALRNAINALPAHYRYKQHLLALTNLAEHFDTKSLTKKRFAKLEKRILIRIEQVLKFSVKKKQLTQTQIAPILKIITSLK